MKKIALLIGNNDYDFKNMSLSYAINDAEELGEALKKLKFEVNVQCNLDQHGLADAFASYSRSLKGYDVGLFFFAGHGFQVDGNNYLAGTDTSFEDSSSMKYTGQLLQSIIDDMQNSELQIKILIIDACRTYAGGVRGIGIGFAPILAPKGTIIAFATSPGQSAKEVDLYKHGLYTKALLQHINAKNITIEEMFKRVRNTVYIESGGKQVSWEHTSLMGEFSFNEDLQISAIQPYSSIALADKDYEPVNNGICYELIGMAKSLNWNQQNRIPSVMNKKEGELYTESADDIFVLGRNLYQSSGKAHMVEEYFGQLHDKLMSYQKSFAEHLLNGMAYEIYFNNVGKLRKQLKTHNTYLNVLTELQSEYFESCKNFIVMQLQGHSQQIIYIPGSKMELDIILNESDNEGNGKRIYFVKRILLDGVDIMYNEDGTELYIPHVVYRYYKDSNADINMLESQILAKVAGTKRGVKLNISLESNEKIDDNIAIQIPYDCTLLRYANDVKEY